MVRKSNWSRRLPHSITRLDGERMTALRDIVGYMDTVGADRQSRRAWRHVAELLLDAAERNDSVAAARKQVLLALLLDGKLDARATAPEIGGSSASLQ
jgi:hypothetical protein